MNPIMLKKEFDDKVGDFRLKCFLYLGGKNLDKVYYGKPIIYDEDKEHFMYSIILSHAWFGQCGFRST